MRSHILVTRAVGAEFLSRKLAGIRLIFILISVLVLAPVIWLTTVSVWWWFLAAPVIVLVSIATMLLVLVWVIIRFIRPTLSSNQNDAIIGFVDKLERVAETVQTPAFMIAFYILKDVIKTPEQTYVERVTSDGTTLHKDFIKLRSLFM